MSRAAANLKTALAYNSITLSQLVEMGEEAALKLPMIGSKVWAEAKWQTNKRRVPRPGSGRRAVDGAVDLVQVAHRVTRAQREKLARIGGSLWLRQAISDAPEAESTDQDQNAP